MENGELQLALETLDVILKTDYEHVPAKLRRPELMRYCESMLTALYHRVRTRTIHDPTHEGMTAHHTRLTFCAHADTMAVVGTAEALISLVVLAICEPGRDARSSIWFPSPQLDF